MLKSKIEDYLLADGVNPAYKGFKYLVEAITAYEATMNFMDLYSVVAEKCHCSNYSVDKNIRSAITKRKPQKEKIPNSEYIANAKIRCERE